LVSSIWNGAYAVTEGPGIFRVEDCATETVICDRRTPWPERVAEMAANARLIAAAPDMLAACKNARDIIATDRQTYVDCQQVHDGRVDDAVAHGLVWVSDGVWLTPGDEAPLRDYDHALQLIDAAIAKATGEPA
jgi:hypothetical protein